jgi:uncharacterized SAM-binding protein YcdF (DUF218 family)
MFFFLSKTLSYLVMPLTIVSGILLYGLITKKPKRKKKLLIIGVSVLLFLSNDFIANEIMAAWEIPARPISSLRKYKLAIVLTGTTMDRLPNDRVYFTKGADRVTHTVQLFKEGLIEKILISGGSGKLAGEEEPEANKFRKAMLLMGIPDSVIIVENETRNTHESALEVKRLLTRYSIRQEECLLITSAFHMRRAHACYGKVGVELETFSTDFYSHTGDYSFDSFLIPKVEALNAWTKLVKEWVGFGAYKVAGYI